MQISTKGASVNLVIVHGVIKTYQLFLKNLDGTAIDLSGCSISAKVKKSITSTTSYTINTEIVDEITGEIYLHFDSSTDLIPSGVNEQDVEAQYIFSFKVTFSNGDKWQMLQGKVFKILGVQS